MLWADYTAALAQMTGLKDVYGQTLLTSLLPRIVDYAELRIFRDPDLDFLATRTADTTQQTTPGTRTVTIPRQFIVLDQVRLVIPPNTPPAHAAAQRVGLLRTSRSFIDMTWPVVSDVAAPAPFQTYYAIFAMQSQGAGIDLQPPGNIIIAPTPDGQYVTEFLGTFRPTPFSASNPQTFLSLFLPDLLISASMIFAAGGLLKNFGAQADDPRQAVSWEAIYVEQKKTAAVEEARKKAQGADWSSYGVPITANLPRTAPLLPPPPPPAGPPG